MCVCVCVRERERDTVCLSVYICSHDEVYMHCIDDQVYMHDEGYMLDEVHMQYYM